MLLDNHADVNAKDVNGNTPLHHAADMCNLDSARLLLAHKADVNAVNLAGETPLRTNIERVAEWKRGHEPASSASRAHKDLAKLLRQYGGHE